MLRKVYQEFRSLKYSAGLGKYSSLLKHAPEMRIDSKGISRCFILATGPSIKTQELSSLENEFCISVSNFFVHPLFNVIKPRYHIFAPTHPPITEDQIHSWLQDGEQHMAEDTPTKIMLHAHDKNVVDKYKLFPNRQIHYYGIGGHYPVDFAKLIPVVQTVVHLAIYLAFYLKIKEVYLLGCDHSWILHYGKSMHFYKEDEHAFTRKNYSEWSEIKDIGQDFKTHAALWDVYREIRKQSHIENIRIYNSTPGSLLDIFPAKDLKEILAP